MLSFAIGSGFLLVRVDVEQDEENQVRAQNNATHRGSKRFARTFSYVGKPWGMGTSPVVPRRKVDEPYVVC